MLLVIEDKDDPTGSTATELDSFSGPELAYIPVIRTPLERDARQTRSRLETELFRYTWRNGGGSRPEPAGGFRFEVGLYRQALSFSAKPQKNTEGETVFMDSRA